MLQTISLLALSALGPTALAPANPFGAPQDRQLEAAPKLTAPAPFGEAAPVAGTLRLRDHNVDVVINNGFATTTVVQTLENATGQSLEATWSFPLPNDASLSELALWIDGTPHVGEVALKSEAQAIYASEKSAGESSAVVEQNGHVDYRVSVSAVPAHGEVKVRVVYYEPLDIDQGVGRYLYPLQDGGTSSDDMNESFWSMEKSVAGAMTIDVSLKTAFPLTGMHSPSHPSATSLEESHDLWRTSWKGSGPVLDKDFVLHYRLAEDVPARIELLTSRYPDQGEGTFMAVITPGSDLEPITFGTDWMFVLDVSGSMTGDKLRVLVQGVESAISTLRVEDRFQIIAFNNGVSPVTTDWALVGTPEATRALEAVRALSAGGGTNIFAALHAAYAELDADRPSAIILVSDGVANTGPHDYRDFIRMAKAHDGRLFTFVMGNGANTTLLGDLASLSGGFAKAVSVQDEVGAHLMLARERMSHEAMHGVQFNLSGASSVHPRRLPSLYLGQQLVVFGRYTGTGPQELSVTAKISGEEKHWSVPVNLPAIDEGNPEIERLYALSAIKDLERAEWLDSRLASETKSAIADMALAYSLVTDETSMVVVREDRKATYGLGSSNRERRVREEDAARVRSIAGNQLQVQTGSAPLAGPRAAHAPSRAQRRSPSGGGRSGGGAIGWLEVMAALALIGLAVTARTR